MRLRGAKGQALPVVAVTMAVLVVALLVIVRVGRLTADRARARTAADAAALAAVREGRSGAAELAARNGAHVTAYTEVGPEVEVTVELGEAKASARARLDAVAEVASPGP